MLTHFVYFFFWPGAQKKMKKNKIRNEKELRENEGIVKKKLVGGRWNRCGFPS